MTMIEKEKEAVGRAVHEGKEDMKEKASDFANTTIEKPEYTKDISKSKMRRAKEAIMDKAEGSKDTMMDKMHNAKEIVMDKAHSLKEGGK